MDPNPDEILLFKQLSPKLPHPLWIRTLCAQEDLPPWVLEAVSSFKPILGEGVVEPLELRVVGKHLSSVSMVDGRRMVEFVWRQEEVLFESALRRLGESLCRALARVHFHRGFHGALVPFNIITDATGEIALWALPTARLELNLGPTDREWEAPYRSPRVLEGNTPNVQDDLYSVGRFLEQLMGPKGPPSESMAGIRERCLSSEPGTQYQSALELARDLFPETNLGHIDFAACRDRSQRALQAWTGGQLEQAQELWLEATQKDPGDFAAWHNLGVAWAAVGEHGLALEHLGKAAAICPNQPINLVAKALCYRALGERDASAEQTALARLLAPKSICLLKQQARWSIEDKLWQPALSQVLPALRKDPKDAATRQMAATVFEALDDQREAEIHRRYAQQLPQLPELHHLIYHRESEPPWNIDSDSRSSVLPGLGLKADFTRGPLFRILEGTSYKSYVAKAGHIEEE